MIAQAFKINDELGQKFEKKNRSISVSEGNSFFVDHSSSERKISEEDCVEGRIFQLAHWEREMSRQRRNC